MEKAGEKRAVFYGNNTALIGVRMTPYGVVNLFGVSHAMIGVIADYFTGREVPT